MKFSAGPRVDGRDPARATRTVSESCSTSAIATPAVVTSGRAIAAGAAAISESDVAAAMSSLVFVVPIMFITPDAVRLTLSGDAG